jgi:hypothetical protein
VFGFLGYFLMENFDRDFCLWGVVNVVSKCRGCGG